MIAGFLMPPIGAWAQDEEIALLKQQIRELQKRVEALEKKRAAQRLESVQAGYGSLKMDGLIQSWSRIDSKGQDTFRLRRTELKFSGNITPGASWTVMFDPAKRLTLQKDARGAVTDIDNRNNVLQDAFVAYRINPHLTVDIGQEKIPFGMEGLRSSAQLDTVERSLLTDVGKLSDRRDIGIQVKWDSRREWELVGSYLNGNELNRDDDNNAGDVAGRAVYRPVSVPGLHLGLALYRGKFGPQKGRNDRSGLELRYERDPLLLSAEAVTARRLGAHIKSYYVLAGWKWNPTWQAVVRYDLYDPDENRPDNTERDFLLGLNYLIDGHHAKWQLNWVRKSFDDPQTPDRDQILTNFQVAF